MPSGSFTKATTYFGRTSTGLARVAPALRRRRVSRSTSSHSKARWSNSLPSRYVEVGYQLSSSTCSEPLLLSAATSPPVAYLVAAEVLHPDGVAIEGDRSV